MSLQRFIGGTKHLRLAVVGAPSSGKTNLLSDLIHSLHAMGCEAERLPLTYPYSSLGTFFYEISGFKTDDSELRKTQHALLGTASYACRPENHYGGIFRLPGSRQKVAIDFVNIPGECFTDYSTLVRAGEQRRMRYYFMLRGAIERLDDAFAVVAYRNPVGRQVLLIEPSDKALASLGLRFNPSALGARATSRQMNYMEWGQIFRELDDTKYERGKKRNISGRELLRRFTDFLPDSFLCTLRNIWPIVAAADKLDYAEIEANEVFKYFYFLVYCQQATDIIICDKLFLPDDTIGTLFNFEEMVSCIEHYYSIGTRHRPNVYLAFTTADLLMREDSTRLHLASAMAVGTPHQRRQRAYNAFRDALVNCMVHPDAPPTDAIDSDFHSRTVMSGSLLTHHLRSRVGSSIGLGFWHLLVMSSPRPSWRFPVSYVEAFLRRRRGQRDPQEAFRECRQMTPQTYFTASPIDLDFTIFCNDSADPTQFVHTAADGTLHSFHMETTRYGKHSLCFGSYQLMSDIFRYNGIDFTCR